MNLSISGSPSDPPRETVTAKPPLDIAAYLARFLPSGLSVTKDEYAARLAICATCIYRVSTITGDRCLACGCHNALKAKLRAFHCPQLLWPGDQPAP
jgi:hypothetical protein